MTTRQPEDKEHTWEGGEWLIRTRKAPIMSTLEHYAWKRELDCFQGQHLPEATYSQNLVELRHSSGLRLRFTALEALRSWASLDMPPVQVPAAKAWAQNRYSPFVTRYDYDYSFTTAHPGSVDMASTSEEQPAACQPDSSSFIVRPAVDLATGAAQLRKPLCKCKGEGGRTPFLQPEAAAKVQGTAAAESSVGTRCPPSWQPSSSSVDIEALIKTEPAPQFWDELLLYEEDLHECGDMFLRVRVYVANDFWVCYQRYYMKVHGVLARLIDSRYQYQKGSPCILRETSWKEGNWDQLQLSDKEDASDHIAARRLPLVRPVVTEELRLPALTDTQPSIPVSLCWRSALPCNILCADTHARSTVVVLVTAGGTVMQGHDTGTGQAVWQRDAPPGAEVLSAAVSPNLDGPTLIALGDDRGFGHVWDISTGSSISSFAVAPALNQARNVTSSKNWVERVVWSPEGTFVAAAAGRSIVIVSAVDGDVVASTVATSGAVIAIEFAPGGGCVLGVGAYGGVQWLVAGNEVAPLPLVRGAAAVQSMSMSPDGSAVAVGFLDKKLRIFSTTGARAMDWSGFSVAVSCVEYSASGEWLAALGGSTVMVVPSALAPGFDSPTLCRTNGSIGADGCGGTCSRFTSIAWCPVMHHEHILAATEANTGKVHLFDVRAKTLQSPCVSRPLMTITPSSSSATGIVAFCTKPRPHTTKNDDVELMILLASAKGEIEAYVIHERQNKFKCELTSCNDSDGLQ